MSNSSLQEKLDAAKAQQAAVKQAPVVEQAPVIDGATDADDQAAQLENLVASFGTELKHPMPPIISDEPSEEDKAAALAEYQAAVSANKPAGLYAYSAGSVFGSSGLVRLTPTAFGNFQTVEDAKATGTIDSWEHLLKTNQAYEIE